MGERGFNEDGGKISESISLFPRREGIEHSTGT
jgi:hypothetical protein